MTLADWASFLDAWYFTVGGDDPGAAFPRA
jgi:hypothetical protein